MFPITVENLMKSREKQKLRTQQDADVLEGLR